MSMSALSANHAILTCFEIVLGGSVEAGSTHLQAMFVLMVGTGSAAAITVVAAVDLSIVSLEGVTAIAAVKLSLTLISVIKSNVRCPRITAWQVLMATFRFTDNFPPLIWFEKSLRQQISRLWAVRCWSPYCQGELEAFSSFQPTFSADEAS